MKVALSLLLGLLLIPSSFAGQCFTKHGLPSAIQVKLDKKFPGWRFAQISDEVRQAMKKEISPDSQLDLIKGDFDGDGQLDYALLIEHGDIFNDAGVAIGRNNHIVAFLKRGDDYKLYLVDSNAGEYLWLRRKGNGGYNYETQKEFTFANDSIEAEIFEKAATSYVYEKGEFRAIITGD